MKPRRTHDSDVVFRLEGGNEDNDLWVTVYDDPAMALGSVWVPTDEERKRIAEGANIELIVWGEAHPPVTLVTNSTPLGKAK
jgi:hypothetical protein